jgi:hypothetical protein
VRELIGDRGEWLRRRESTLNFAKAGETPGGTRSTEASVTCLSAVGNQATIGFTGVGGNIQLMPDWVAGLIRVVDGGPPASSLDTWQIVILASESTLSRHIPLPGPTDCSALPSTFVPPPLLNNIGDLVVIDTQPLPATKEQCKNGGWRNYGTTFKNQGQCVAFVQRGPRPD